MNSVRALSLATLCGLLCACSAPSESPAQVALVQVVPGNAFDLSAVMAGDAGIDFCDGWCTPATLLVTSVTPTEMQVVWGAEGKAIPLTLTRAGDAWMSSTPVTIEHPGEAHAICPTAFILETASFDFSDHNHDGAIDLLIAGHATHQRCADDYNYSTDSDVTITGLPDTRAPAASWPGSVFPMQGFSMVIDKPLEPAATASLAPVGGGEPIALTPSIDGGYVVEFSTRRILPLGARYAVTFSGTDFAGVSTPAGGELTTTDDFGVLVQDGFESGSTAGVRGADVVESYGIPAISGQRMLHVWPGTPALMRLRRTGSEQNLVMVARWLSHCTCCPSGGAVSLVVGVVGSDNVYHSAIEHIEMPTELPGQVGYVGSLKTITVPLPAEGEDVLVRAQGDPYNGAVCAQTGALIDDVKLE